MVAVMFASMFFALSVAAGFPLLYQHVNMLAC